jgi:hypothetical protein
VETISQIIVLDDQEYVLRGEGCVVDRVCKWGREKVRGEQGWPIYMLFGLSYRNHASIAMNLLLKLESKVFEVAFMIYPRILRG